MKYSDTDKILKCPVEVLNKVMLIYNSRSQIINYSINTFASNLKSRSILAALISR